MYRIARLTLLTLCSLAAVPSAVYAQAAIVGVVRDTSGAVLPGVTVEASSPALIEKTRSGVTDATGQYRIENLRPGPYTVVFTLPGFSTVKREGIELTGMFTASINAELRVGALEETITVTGETPIVDVQSTTRQRVLDQQIMDAIPSARVPVLMAALLPGVVTARQDVGGLLGDGSARGAVTVHGNSDVRTLINGVSIHSANGAGSTGAANIAAFQEMAVDTGGISAEQKEGGVRMNLIPRDGGNTPRAYFFGNFATHAMQGSNFTQDLKDRGLGTPDSVKRVWDLNPAYGGPIKRDKIWFHATARYTGALSYVPMFFNKNAGNPDAWTYEADAARGPAWTETTWKNGNGRITWQANPTHKVAFSYDHSVSCDCPRTLTASVAPEANVTNYAFLDPKRMLSGDWTAPVTNRLLFDAAVLKHDELALRPTENVYFAAQPAAKLSSVTEQSTGLSYRASSGGMETWNRTLQMRAAASYITGAHAFKVGFNYGVGSQNQLQYDIDAPMSFRFNNGVPNQLTLRATPYRSIMEYDDHGMFVQDRWTIKRATLTGGLRYDHFHDSFPEATIGPGRFAPNRNILLPATSGVSWHDLQPRTGLAYDIFGDGKTALKVSLNKYLANQAASGIFATDMAPSRRLVNSTTRSWNDSTFAAGDPRRGNFVPDCDLINVAANGECGAMANPNFGTIVPDLTYDPDTLAGWGKRDHNWEFSAGIQRELLPRISMDVSFFRRWFGNFIVTDNRATSAADYDTFSITAPLDPRLPGGGGYVVSGLYDVKPAKFSVPADNYLTFSDNYGKQIRHWNGVDVTINARPRDGMMLGGGVSTGRTTTNNCEIVRELPERLFSAQNVGDANNNVWLPASACDQQSPFLTQVKLLGTYTVPRVDLQMTATYQGLPGPQIVANYTATNAVVAPSLGRNLAGTANNLVVNILEPGTSYGERTNQIDLRIGKILRLGRMRATASVDLYNALNASSVLTLNNAFATWQRPQQILNARFAKVGVQLDF